MNCVWPLILPLLLLTTTHAQTPAPLPRAKLPLLSDALADAKPAPDGVALAVGATWTRLRPGAALPDADAPLDRVAEAFGRTTRRFGAVTALASPTMSVINTAPASPDIFADLSPGDAFKFLAASLNEAQWRALTGERGLGLADLTSDDQRTLFASLFPKRLFIQPKPVPGKEIGPNDGRDVTADLPQARLRFGQRMDINVPTQDNSSVALNDWYEPNGPAWVLNSDAPSAPNAAFGVPVRAEVANVPKDSQLDMVGGEFQRPISLAGLKTVGDLTARIGKVAQTEIYCDKRLEDFPISMVGAAPTAGAGDLLRALAFCLTGTYRRVGPAFVLTEDIVGAGTRQQIWAEFAEDVRLMREGPLRQATATLGTLHSPHDLSWFGDALAYGPNQHTNSDPQFPRAEMTFDQLTPAQQKAVQGLAAQFEANPERNVGGGDPLKIDVHGKIRLEARPSVQLFLPSLDTPIDMQELSRTLFEIGQIFEPSETAEQAMVSRYLARQKERDAQREATEGPKLAALLASIPRRAVLAHPRTVEEVDTLVASMRRTGLNELWLDVFSDGGAHIPVGRDGRPLLSTDKKPADILSEALAVTQRAKIRVFPVLSLLAWSATAPDADLDLTLLGEDALQTDARLAKRYAFIVDQVRRLGVEPPQMGFQSERVSPFSPHVRDTLATLIQSLAARPGVAGLVWQDTVSPGYDIPTGERHDTLGDVAYRSPLGYTEVARLAFLRREHVDPIDIAPPLSGTEGAASELFSGSSDEALFPHWNQFRAKADTDLLQRLYAAAMFVQKTPILIRQRRDVDEDSTGTSLWFGSWDDPKQPLPAFHHAGEDVAEGQPWPEQQPAVTQAKAQSRAALIRLAPHGPPTRGWLSEQLEPVVGEPWDGFVLDLTRQRFFGVPEGPSASDADPLRSLAAPGL